MTDQIVTDLARFKALFVLSMNSTAKYQERSADPHELKRELGVDYLLDGSVRRERDQSDSQLVWSMRPPARSSGSETYSDELIPSNVFEISGTGFGKKVSAIVAGNYGLIAEEDLDRSATPPAKVICPLM